MIANLKLLLVPFFLISVSLARADDCFVRGQVIGALIGALLEEDVGPLECLEACKATPDCRWFPVEEADTFCGLFRNCETLNELKPNAISGTYVHKVIRTYLISSNLTCHG